MNAHARDLWERAKKAVSVAENLLSLDSDAAASRAYYAAFYAVSALFALKGQTFSRHSAVDAAVHRDLVKGGTFPEQLGEAYSRLVQLRNTGDYGGAEHVPPEEAKGAVEAAQELLQAVARSHGDELS